MRVAFLNPQGNFDPADSYWTAHPDFGGQLVYVKEVAVALAGLGVDVDIVTRRIRDEAWPEFAADEDDYAGHAGNPRILRIPCGGDSFLPKEELWPHLPDFVERLLETYGTDRPDFVTAHYGDGGYCAVLAQERSGIGFTFTGHSLGAQKMDKLGVSAENAEEVERSYRFSRRIDAERLAMERAARVVTSTSQERLEQYSHPLYSGAVDVQDDTRFAVIPPGVNTDVFTTSAGPDDQAVARRHLQGGLANEPCVIVSSRLDVKKNIGGVVDAYVADGRLSERARLAIVLRGVVDPWADAGGLPEAEREVLEPMLATIEGAGLRDRVDFLDLRSQHALAAAYRSVARRGSVFALTAFYEPFGLAPIEAAACGLPVVATRNGGPSEVFADGAGVLVDPSDPADIARGLLEALDDAEGYASRGARRVAEKYTWRATAARYLEVIEEHVTRGPTAAGAVPALEAGPRIRDYLANRD